MKKLLLFVVILLVGCNQGYSYGYGVACDQNGHLSEVTIQNNGVTNHVSDFNPPAQTCTISQDGSIIIRNSLQMAVQAPVQQQ
jgi:hypothetical protein